MSLLRSFNTALRLSAAPSKTAKPAAIAVRSRQFSASSAQLKLNTKAFEEIYPNIREKFLNDEGKVDTKECAKEAGRKWNDLSDAEKEPYVSKGKQLGDAYKSQYSKYYDSLSHEQISLLNKVLPRPLSVPDAGKLTTSQIKAKRRRPGEPAKGVSGFLLFMADFRNSAEFEEMVKREGIDGKSKMAFAAKKGGEKWNMLSEEEKERYKNIDADKRAAHKAWKEEQKKSDQ